MKLTYSFLLLVFSVIIIGEITGIYVLYEFKNTLENQITNDSEKLNIMMINRIDGYATERLADLINLAKSGAFEATIQDSNTEFSKMNDPEQYVDKMDSAWTSIPSNETTPFMKALIDSESSKQLRQIENDENNLFHGKIYGEIFMTNAYGANVIETDKTSDYKQSDEVWWQEARKNGIYIGGAEFDVSSGTTSYAVATRLDDENGNFIGVAKAVVNIEQIINIIKTQMNITNTSPVEYELLKNDNSVIYSTNLIEEPNSLSNISIYKNELEKFSGHFKYTENDQIYLVTYSHSPSSKISPLFDWIFTTTYKSSEVLKPVEKITNDLTILMIITITTLSIIVFIMTKKLGTPIEKIYEAMSEYNKGNRLEIKPQGTLEIRELISEFNYMIEEIKNNEEKLKKSENLYRELFELSPDPIRISTLDRITVDVNQSFLKKFGYTKEEIVGKPIYENIDNSSLRDIENVFDKLRKGENVDNIETTYHTKDGRKIPVLLSVSSFNDQSGNVIGNIAIIKDISEIYTARKAITKKIENAVNQYTQIKDVEKQKDQFASMISHELTTPLFPIKFQAEMLKDPKLLGKLNKEQTNSVNEIYQNAMRLERLIEDILDAQKLEMNSMRFIKSNFELKQFMNKIVDLGKNIIANKEIKIENSTKDQITLISDSDRLIQVFTNLIKNSVDFVPEKTGKIEIGAEIQENDILFHVKDNGIGIPKDRQDNLFKKFYQIDTSLKRNHRGSGLGLSICKGIVEGLGGVIWLESTENVGTIAYFTIPKGDTN